MGEGMRGIDLTEKSLRKRHQVGKHVLTFADNGADWCRACGEFDFALGAGPCRSVPKNKRWWPQGAVRRERV
jgi:hypothetical protein